MQLGITFQTPMITIDYKPTAHSLYRQLKGKVAPYDILVSENTRSAINYLWSLGILTPKQTNGAFNRLTNSINLAAQEWAADNH